MSWFGELVVAAAFADPSAEGPDGAIHARHPLSAPFCHNLPVPPLRFGTGSEPLLRRFRGASWLAAPMPAATVTASGRPVLAGRRVHADLRGVAPEEQRATIETLSATAGAPPCLLRQGRDDPAPGGYVPIWEADDRADIVWLASEQRERPFGRRMAAFVARHISGELDAFDTALALISRPGPVTRLRFLADGDAALCFDPVWCLCGVDGIRAARTMLSGLVTAGREDPAELMVPPIPGAVDRLEIALEGSERAVAECRVLLDGRAVAADGRWRRGAARIAFALPPAQAGLGHRVTLLADDVTVRGLWVPLAAPLPGLYGREFDDPLDRYADPDGAAR